MAVRHAVFVVGQGVPLAIEQDGRDPDCVHLIARAGDRVIGTARLRPVGHDAKAERVAVTADQRGRGLGVGLMAVLEEEARRLGLHRVILHAQAPVVAFYERLGYEGVGARFVEAGIEHLAMHKELQQEA